MTPDIVNEILTLVEDIAILQAQVSFDSAMYKTLSSVREELQKVLNEIGT